MSNKPLEAEQGILPYYERQGISPVRYRMDSVQEHFDRRDSLYRSLGLPPAAFRGSRVLEVAAGSGQNSLYIASCLPRSFDLLEPNPAGIRDIREAYGSFRRPHTAPVLHEVRLEDFTARDKFDIVVCENWLGSLPQDSGLIETLASLVSPGGVLVMTCVPVAGFFPNLMRKLLALRLIDRGQSFERQSARLVDMFSPHLTTMADMTRSHRDWVHDTMLLPSYLQIALPPEKLLDAVGGRMEVLATFPRFTPDWRWFKSLTGEKRRFNEQMLNAYRENLHNFIDYRKTWPARPAHENAGLNAAFAALYDTATAAVREDILAASVNDIGAQLSAVLAGLEPVDRDVHAAVAELKSVWQHPQLSPDMVRDMRTFSPLFGRETVYISFTRRHDSHP